MMMDGNGGYSAVQCSTPQSIRSPDNPRFRFRFVNAYDDLIMETNEINIIKENSRVLFWGVPTDVAIRQQPSSQAKID